MGDTFVLDMTCPPKYCPECQEQGLLTKVKKFRLKADNALVLMCKNDQCPWPFNKYSQEEVTIRQEPGTQLKENKRKREPPDEPGLDRQDSKRFRNQGDAQEVLAAIDEPVDDQAVESIGLDHEQLDFEPESIHEAEETGASQLDDTLHPISKLEAAFLTESKSLLQVEPADVALVEMPAAVSEPAFANLAEPAAVRSVRSRGDKSSGSEAVKSSELPCAGLADLEKVQIDDSSLFKAVPTAIRQPLKLSKHASHILDSRMSEEASDNECSETGDQFGGSDEDELSGVDLQLDESDSELESLASQCSTMTTVSGASSQHDQAGQGLGKVKRRGRKKKRKARRKLHSTKCSKAEARASDISAACLAELETEQATPAARELFSLPDLEKIGEDLNQNLNNKEQDDVEQGAGRVVNLELRADRNPDERGEQQREDSVKSSTALLNDLAPLPLSDGPLTPAISPLTDSDTTGQTASIPPTSPGYISKKPSEEKSMALPLSPLSQGGHLTGSVVEQDLPSYVSRNSSSSAMKAKKSEDDLLFKSPLVPVRSYHSPRRSHFSPRSSHPPSPGWPADTSVPSPKYCPFLCDPLSPMPPTPQYVHVDDDEEADGGEEGSGVTVEPAVTSTTASQKSRPCVEPRRGRGRLDQVLQNLKKTAEIQAANSSGNKAAQSLQSPVIGITGRLRKAIEKPTKAETLETVASKPTPLVNMHPDSNRLESFENASTSIFQIDLDPLSYSASGSTKADTNGRHVVSATAEEDLADSITVELVERVRKSLEQQTKAVPSPGGNKRTPLPPDTNGKMKTCAPARPKAVHQQNGLVSSTSGIDVNLDISPEASTNFTYPCLTLSQLEEEEDADYALVQKIGVGSTATPTFSANPLDMPVELEESHPVEKSQCVFHVAQTMSINMPVVGENLEIRERASTKILLTSGSDEIDAHSLRAELKFSKAPTRRGGPSDKGAQSGHGWFIWRQWRVDETLIQEFSDYIDAVAKKWGAEPVIALDREKQSRPDDQGIQDITDFFVQVFAKAYYLKVQARLDVIGCLNYIRDKFHLDNKEFLQLVKTSPPPRSPARRQLKVSTAELRGVLPPHVISQLSNPKIPPSNFLLPLPPAVRQQMVAASMPSMLSQNGMPPTMRAFHPVVAKQELACSTLNAVKGEPDETFPNLPSVQMVAMDPNYQTRVFKVDPDAPPSSVYSNMTASVRVVDPTEEPATNLPAQVGHGSKCLQFFYENPQDGEKIAFNPVFVDNEEEVQCVVALVAERAAEYQSKVGLRPRPVQYYSDAVRAKSRLDPEVVRYIERCFTKKGMREHRKGFKKRTYPKRKDRVIINKKAKSEPTLEQEEEEEEEEQVLEPVIRRRPPRVEPVRVEILEQPSSEEEEAMVDDDRDEDFMGYVSDEDSSRRNLEQLVFGSVMPKVRLKDRDLAKPPSDRAGRGGHNVRDETNQEDVLNAVGYILNPESMGVDSQFVKQVQVASKFKRQKVRARKPSSSSETSEDEDLTEDLYNSNEGGHHVRQSARLNKKFSQKKASELTAVAVQPADSEAQAVQQTTELSDRPDSEFSQPPEDQRAESRQLEVATPTAASPTRRVTFSSYSGHTTNVSTSVVTQVRVDVRRNTEAEAGLLEDMIRAASRNSSRPSSRGGEEGPMGSRPASRVESRAESRAGSRARKAFGVDPGTIEEPDRDSPVLTPRARRLEKERRAASLSQSPPKHLPPPAEQKINESYVNHQVPGTSSTDTAAVANKYFVTSLQNFDQKTVKKSMLKKVSKLLARQKRKAERLERKKYRGFGQVAAVDDGGAAETKKIEKQEQRQMRKQKLSAAKNSHLTQEETDLIASLLQEAESAVLQSQTKVEEAPTLLQEAGAPLDNYILEFEESHTLQTHSEVQEELFDF